MDSFTISQLQQFSGINVHSIRAWEKRYNALQPHRSEGNTRYYNGSQLRRLLNIASLMNSDYKISELCAFSDSELYGLMNELFLQNKTIDNDEFWVSQVVSSALEYNEVLFDKVFSKSIKQYGLEVTYLKVIYPALQRLGIMWSADKIAPAQEHFISNLIKQKFNSSINELPINSNSKKHWLLFLPENEFHENGLLMANYLVRNAGQRTTYLGTNVPFDSLKNVVEKLKPSSLLFFLVSKNDEQYDKELIRLILKMFPRQKIFVAADPQRLSNIKQYKNLTLLPSVSALKKALI